MEEYETIEVEQLPIFIEPLKNDLIIFGLKRGGHHAILHWIACHFNGTVQHFNNCRITQDLKIYIPNHFSIDNIGEGPPALSIYSFEDIDISKPTPPCIKGLKTVLVLRDPYNTYASRIMKYRNVFIKGDYKPYDEIDIWKNYMDTNLWKIYAKEFTGKTTHMPGAITVNYNKWFYSEAYRRELSRPFGPFTDKGLNFIPNHGGGSSFDGHYYQGIAQDMMVLDRYKTLMADKEFQENVLIDEDLQALSKEIFNMVIKKPRLF